MRLYLYYSLHSLLNQIRKMLKTWVLIFLLVCMVFGGVIGFGASRLEDLSEEQNTEDVSPEPEESRPGLFSALGDDAGGVMELAAGGAILAILVWQVLSADKNGSRIFLPADVNLLFSAPMKPQSVLIFRLGTRLGMFVFMGLYLLLQVPNLTLNLGMTVWAALALIAVWCLTVMTGTLLQALVYTVSSTYPRWKSRVRRIVYALLGVLLLGFILYWKGSGREVLDGAMAFFNAPGTRFIPVWGWLKGFFLYAAEGNAPLAGVCFLLTAAGMAALLWVIHRVKADFYEDAMARSEETAELMERARSEKSTGVVFKKRNKDRGDGLIRDGMTRGKGAWVFFHKAIYNRFRFAHLHFFTKTMETYLAAAAAVALLCRMVFATDSMAPLALTMAGLAFFRSLGNPLEQDTKMDFFILIPESMWTKLFASLLGGTVNCLLDVLPAMVAGALILGGDVLTALAWVPFVVSVDFYATCVGTFINLSVPTAAGATVKQIVQVMFIYFGLLPDAAVMAVGLVLGRTAPAALLAAGINVLLGLVFFALSPLFLTPAEGKPPRQAAAADVDRTAAKRVFSRLGLGSILILLVGSALQILAAKLVPGEWYDDPWLPWAVTFVPLYCVAVPLGWLVIRRAPAEKREPWSLTPRRYAEIILICVFMMYAGNILGNLVNLLLSALTPASPGNPVLSFAMDDSVVLKILFMVILAPCIEEFIFRRLLIDRMRPYGGRLAVVTSALMFGLFHGNLSQFFYAFALGLVFGYVYLKTGRLRCSVGLHMLINFLGSVAGPALLQRADLDSLPELTGMGSLGQALTPGRIIFFAYAIMLICLGVAGLVTLCIRAREIRFDSEPLELPAGARFSTVWLNPGMIAFFLGCAGLIVYYTVR